MYKNTNTETSLNLTEKIALSPQDQKFTGTRATLEAIERNRDPTVEANYKKLKVQFLGKYYAENQQILQKELTEYEQLKEKGKLLQFTDMLDVLKNSNVAVDQYKGLALLSERILRSRPVNQVFTISLGSKINMNHVLENAKKHELDIKTYPKFTGVRLKIRQQLGEHELIYTLMFFRSGKINCLGIRKSEDAYVDSVKLHAKKQIQNLVGPLKNTPIAEEFTLVNRVLSVKIPALINLKHLYLFNELKNWRNIKYNNQLFPGVIAKNEQSKVRINFFSTGSAIFTGVKDHERRLNSALGFIKLLQEYLVLLNRKTLSQDLLLQ